MFFCCVSQFFWFSVRTSSWVAISLVTNILLILTLVMIWRSYKIIYSRRHLLPVSKKDAILITGATSGIGLAVAKHLHSIGYSVIAAYYNPNEKGYTELSELQSKGNNKRSLFLTELDVSNGQSIKNAGDAIRTILKEHNLNLYSVINNAGLGSLQPFPWLQKNTIRRLVETNFLGSLLVTREFLPSLIKSKGRLVNVSSGLGFIPGETYIAYGCTKNAQLFFTRGLNIEMKKYGVKSIAVVPHNFIKATNITTQNAKHVEQAWSELTDEEKALYKTDIEAHFDLSKRLNAASEEYKKKPQQVETLLRKQQNPGLVHKVTSILAAIVAALKGVNRAETIESSGVLECFEDALRLPYPPEIMFAGDPAYSFLIGSLLLILPSSCASILGHSVTPNLYR